LRNTPPPTRECPIITRVDIAWVCVATDDPSPLHLDDAYAHEAGHRFFNSPVLLQRRAQIAARRRIAGVERNRLLQRLDRFRPSPQRRQRQTEIAPGIVSIRVQI